MKIICISDTHGKHEQLIVPEADVLVFAGDMNCNNMIQLQKFNGWLNRLPVKYKIIIAGNHDHYPYKEPSMTKRCLNAIYLCDNGVEIGGVKFWGSPYTSEFMNWYFMEHPDKLPMHWDLIPSNTDVLITHSPPFEIGDVSIFDKTHIGCKKLYDKILQIQPKFHIFGHNHSGYGTYKIGNTTSTNTSLLNDNYDLVNQPIEIEI